MKKYRTFSFLLLIPMVLSMLCVPSFALEELHLVVGILGEKDAAESDQPQRRSGKDVNENQQPHSRTTALGRTAAPTAPVTRTIFLVVFDPE